MDLKVEVAADGSRVAGLTDRADALTGPNALATMNR
jgi:hypothetical protein